MIDIPGLRTWTAALIATLAPAANAAAEPMLVISGAGYGHGVGMSQYGAYGYAVHGSDYKTILAHYYSGTAIGGLPTTPRVRVLLQADRTSVTVSGAGAIGHHRLTASISYRAIPAAGGMIALRGRGKALLARAPLTITASAPFKLHGRAINGLRNGLYRGALTLRIAPSGKLDAINAVALDDYVRGVVPVEADPSWPAAALDAQAVAARTYAITTSAGSARGFDQYADTRSQQYGGAGAETAATDHAVAATRGQVVTYGGKPAVTYFFASSGGMTENVENSFIGSAPQPWLRGVQDPYDDSAPQHRWGPLKFTLAQAQARLAGVVKGSFEGIEVTQRGVSPRVVYADVVGSGGRTRVTGPELRSRFGLDDTWAFFAVTGPDGNPPPGFGQLPGPGSPPPFSGGGGAGSGAGSSSGATGGAASGSGPAPPAAAVIAGGASPG